MAHNPFAWGPCRAVRSWPSDTKSGAKKPYRLVSTEGVSVIDLDSRGLLEKSYHLRAYKILEFFRRLVSRSVSIRSPVNWSRAEAGSGAAKLQVSASVRMGLQRIVESSSKETW